MWCEQLCDVNFSPEWTDYAGQDLAPKEVDLPLVPKHDWNRSATRAKF